MSIDILKSLYYELLSYFIPQKVKYTVEGKCNKCGNCCRQIRAKGLNNEKELRFIQFLIPVYKRFFISGRDDYGNIILSCKFLAENGECTVYNSRPRLCKNYPRKSINFNAQMPDGCGFKIVKKNFKDFL